jgi:HK97 family phage major capsid protein
MATLKEKLDEMARIKGELQRMETSEETTEETDGDYRDTLVERWQQLDGECKPIIERMERIKAITRTAQDEGNLERPEPAYAGNGGDGNGARRTAQGSPDFWGQSGRSPYENLQAVRSNVITRSELRGRALDAVELEAKRGNLGHDFAEEVTRKAQDSFGGQCNIARHILLTGSEEYQEAFRAYLENPQEEAQRAALSLTQANGGFLLPFVLDPSIILTNASSANPWRRISNIKQTTSNTWNGVNSAGVTAVWLQEATALTTDNSPSVGNIVVTPQKAAAFVFGSYEVLEDTDFGQQLPALLADAKDRLEEAAFATGAGSGGVPQGVVNGATTVVTTATTLVVAIGDVYAVQAALPPRFRNAPGAAWVANVAQINRFRQLDVAGGSSFWTNLGKGQPETLLGAPIYESTTMASGVASGALEAIFGDFGQFLIVDRVGVSLIYDPLIKGTSSPFLPSGQAGWLMFWRTGSALSTVNAFRVMKGA